MLHICRADIILYLYTLDEYILYAGIPTFDFLRRTNDIKPIVFFFLVFYDVLLLRNSYNFCTCSVGIEIRAPRCVECNNLLTAV